MLVYKTFSTETRDDGALITTVSWQGSQTESSKARGAFKKAGLKAESQTVNIPTAKGPLIEWLNEHVIN